MYCPVMCVYEFVCQGVDNSQLVKDIDEQIESLNDSVGWAQDNINECQANIVHLEESKVHFFLPGYCNSYYCVW